MDKMINMLKYIILFSMFMLVAGVYSFSQDGGPVSKQPPFLPVNPAVMAQGGAFTADANGYNSLFYNPAGFAVGDGGLTIASITPWGYSDPFTLMTLHHSSSVSADRLLTDLVSSGGYGGGYAGLISFVKAGLGIGAAFVFDSYLHGNEELTQTDGSVHMTLGFVLGYAYLFTFPGFSLSIGADVRPMARVYVPVTETLAVRLFEEYITGGSDVIGVLDNAPALSGIGIGFDAGLIADFGIIKCGLSFRDIGGTLFDYRESTFDEIMTSLADSGVFPEDAEKPEERYIIPMNVSAGVSVHPDLGDLEDIVKPVFHLDLQDIVEVFAEHRDPLLLLHIGAEATLFEIFSLKAGFAGGHFSLGAGVKLWFLDINMAFFTTERGTSAGDVPNSCSAIEVAARLAL
ncbi:MAG: hypothetical protein JW881_11910 [Spirochaetales bacterium]|nr:hypothetical protein [Spirochaetales bacterium]